MRVKIEGVIDKNQLYNVLDDLFARYPDIYAMTGVNFYSTFRDIDGNPVALLGDQGNPLEILTYKERIVQAPMHHPNKKTSKPKLSVVKSA